VGLEEPVVCNVIKCNRTNTKTIKGRIKWKEKNRVRVGFLTENPPQIHSTIEKPK